MKYFLLFTTLLISSCANDWSYDGFSSSKEWGDIKHEYRFCKIGYNQSPIDVKYKFEKPKLKFYLKDDIEFEKFRQSYILKIEAHDRLYLKRHKKKYYIRWIGFNHPSEHLINSNRHSLEMQIYFKSDDEQWLVFAQFLEIDLKNDKDNKKIQNIIDLITSKEKEGKANLSGILHKKIKTFYYDGSFTTPPCKEGVKWYVIKDPIYISKQQMNAIIKNAIFTSSNARDVQEFHIDRY